MSFVSDVSDWAILNDTTSKQLERILVEFHHLGESEIARACVLLESYHAVYRRDRIQQRRNQIVSGQTRIKTLCPPPTATQLYEIAQQVNAKAALHIPPEQLIIQLQELAKHLRHYHSYVREGLKKRGTRDNQNHPLKLDRIDWSDFTNHWHNPNEPLVCLVSPLGRIQPSSSDLSLSQSRTNRRCCGR